MCTSYTRVCARFIPSLYPCGQWHTHTHSHSRRVCMYTFLHRHCFILYILKSIYFFSYSLIPERCEKMRPYILKIGRKHSIERISIFFLFGVILIISKRNLHLFSINSIQVPSPCIRARRSHHNENWIINAFFWLDAPSFLNGQTLFVLFHTN